MWESSKTILSGFPRSQVHDIGDRSFCKDLFGHAINGDKDLHYIYHRYISFVIISHWRQKGVREDPRVGGDVMNPMRHLFLT